MMASSDDAAAAAASAAAAAAVTRQQPEEDHNYHPNPTNYHGVAEGGEGGGMVATQVSRIESSLHPPPPSETTTAATATAATATTSTNGVKGGGGGKVNPQDATILLNPLRNTNNKAADPSTAAAAETTTGSATATAAVTNTEATALSTTTTMEADFAVTVHDDNDNDDQKQQQEDEEEEKEESSSNSTPPLPLPSKQNMPPSQQHSQSLASVPEAAEEEEEQVEEGDIGTLIGMNKKPATVKQRTSSSSRQNRINKLQAQRPKRDRAKSRYITLLEEETTTDNNDMATTTVAASQKKKKLGLSAPPNQYECRLVRRAIRPLDHDHPYPDEDEEGNGIYGDISLGMKLSVADTGDVIVQHVIPLADGRASPAQLTGVIKRGDILLSVDNINLMDNTVQALQKLKAPEDTTSVACQREYKLRFAAGEGHALLQMIDEQRRQKEALLLQRQNNNALFPMVDQLSGVPMFVDMSTSTTTNDQENEQPPPAGTVAATTITSSSTAITTTTTESQLSSSSVVQQQQQQSPPPPMMLSSPKQQQHLSINDRISDSLATLRVQDRNIFLIVNDDDDDTNGDSSSSRSTLLFWVGRRDSSWRKQGEAGGGGEKLLTLRERQELGQKAMAGAKNLYKQVENIDAGKDLRSFQNWNTTLSLYSRASTRRKHLFDAASLPLNFDTVKEEDEDDDDDSSAGAVGSQNSSAAGSEEQLDGDELLLRLAAHDEIWRRQVLEFLEKVAKQEQDEESESSNGNNAEDATDIDVAMSMELGSFLFGSDMSKILAKHKKPRALPPEEVTAVLFDLATKLSASVPDEIKASGPSVSFRSGLVPFKVKRHAVGSDVSLAYRYLIDDALPAWLQSFRPLAWEHRRILWPPVDRLHNHHHGSTSASSFSDDDITIDSVSTGIRSSTANSSARHRKRKKDIREIIEDKELNIETRGETCFLTTYYFLHAMLPRLMPNKEPVVDDSILPMEQQASMTTKEEIDTFLKSYGSYLKLHTCLAYAAVLEADSVLAMLLRMAKYDPRHREVIKQTSKSFSMVFYEPTMLSAVMQLLYGINKETNPSRRQGIADLCSSAFPDVRPWQVQKACTASQEGAAVSQEVLDDVYYSYLSMLLDPVDGHQIARSDLALVKEWCELSVQGALETEKDEIKAKKRRDNFLSVASRASSHHRAFRRDLPHLLTLSMELKEYGLALDLAAEILDDPKQSKDSASLELVMDELRALGLECLDPDESRKQESSGMLKRVLHLYEKPAFRRKFDVHWELLRLIDLEGQGGSTSDGTPASRELIDFLAEEARPDDLLRSLVIGDSTPNYQNDILPVLHTALKRGITSTASELSTSLLRIKKARSHLDSLSDTIPVTDTTISGTAKPASEHSIWKSMSMGRGVDMDK